MRILYLDCGMGAAGDMLTAALLELMPDGAACVDELNALGIPGVQYVREKAVKCGVTGTHMSVLVHVAEEGEDHPHDHEHEHHDHEHGHDHDHEHDHHHHEHDHPHEHDHDHPHDHAHEYHDHHDHEHHEQEHDEHHHDHEHAHDHEHHHHHSSLGDIAGIVSALPLPEPVRADVLAVYELIAEAEAHVHGVPVPDIHFHEVGTLDAVADVAAVCLLLRRLAPDVIAASPVSTGTGHVHCAHGILPVPAPATAYILRGIPIQGGGVEGELCTPTGAALLKHFVTHFGELPVLRPEKIGYGMGKKDFPRANCVRAILGETGGGAAYPLDLGPAPERRTPEWMEADRRAVPADGLSPDTPADFASPDTSADGLPPDTPADFASPDIPAEGLSPEAPAAENLFLLSCNVDDMTAEEIGFAMERLLEAGAREAYTVPAGMKKSRPGILLEVLCTADRREALLEELFRHTTTIGVRETAVRRYALARTTEARQTVYGTVRRKRSSGWGVVREKAEYEDLARIARERGISLREARELVEQNPTDSGN